MRLISQDGCKDIPYANAMLTVAESYRGGCYINATVNSSAAPVSMGLYSTEEKALKVIGMIEEAYREHNASNISLSGIGGSFVFVDDGIAAQKITDLLAAKLRDCAYFRFPQDSEA